MSVVKLQFPKLFWLYLKGIICLINHACLASNKTSLAEGYSIWMKWTIVIFTKWPIAMLSRYPLTMYPFMICILHCSHSQNFGFIHKHAKSKWQQEGNKQTGGITWSHALTNIHMLMLSVGMVKWFCLTCALATLGCFMQCLLKGNNP